MERWVKSVDVVLTHEASIDVPTLLSDFHTIIIAMPVPLLVFQSSRSR